MLAVCTAAFFFDIITYKIPNALMAAGAFASLILACSLSGVPGFLAWISGMIMPLLILLPLFKFRMIGAGDVKLFAVIGSFTYFPAIMRFMFFCLIASSLCALILILRSGNLKARFIYFASYCHSYFKTGKLRRYIIPGNRPENFHLTMPVLICTVLYTGGIIK